MLTTVCLAMTTSKLKSKKTWFWTGTKKKLSLLKTELKRDWETVTVRFVCQFVASFLKCYSCVLGSGIALNVSNIQSRTMFVLTNKRSWNDNYNHTKYSKIDRVSDIRREIVNICIFGPKRSAAKNLIQLF